MASELAEGRSATESERPGFEIEGERYDVPRLDELDLDEEQILFDLAGIVQVDFAPAHPEASEEERQEITREIVAKVRNPAFKRALAHIAYRRRHPETAFSDVQLVVGKVNALDAEVALIRGDSEDPQTSSPNEPESNGTTSEPSRSEASGTPSGSDSEPVAEIHVLTGTGS